MNFNLINVVQLSEIRISKFILVKLQSPFSLCFISVLPVGYYGYETVDRKNFVYCKMPRCLLFQLSTIDAMYILYCYGINASTVYNHV